MNILLSTMMHMTGDVCDRIKRDVPGVLVTVNLEQVLAMIKLGEEISRVCILWGGFNVDGYEAARMIHDINPGIPILVWDSMVLPEGPRLNETYLKCTDFDTDQFWQVFYNFYAGLPIC